MALVTPNLLSSPLLIFLREQKNYTEVAKKIITTKIENQVFQKDGITVILEKVQKIKGDVSGIFYQFALITKRLKSVSERANKSSLILSIWNLIGQVLENSKSIPLMITAENEEDNANGTFNIHEVNESDLDYEVRSKIVIFLTLTDYTNHC